MKTRAPWTAEQVEALRAWQTCGWVHPFTCGNSHEGERVLIPTRTGWTCPTCDYRQDWAHDFMLQGPPPNPVEALLGRSGAG